MKPAFETGAISRILDTIFFCNVASFIMIFMLIFVPWKNGCACWKKFAPGLYLVLVWLLFLGLPIAVITTSLCICLLDRESAQNSS